MSQRTPSVTQTVHITKPTDKVPGIDVYTDKRETPINLISKKLGGITEEIMKSFAGTFSDTNMFKLADDIQTIVGDPKQARERINQLKGSYKNMMRDLGSNVASNILNGLGVLDKPDDLMDGLFGVDGKPTLEEAALARMPKLRVVLEDGSIKKLVDGDFETARDLTTLISSVTGNKEIVKLFDLEAAFGVVDSIVKTARELGLDDLYDTIDAFVEDHDDRAEVLIRGVESAGSFADVKYLNKTIDEIGAERMAIIYPNLARDCLAAYVKKNTEQSDQAAIADLINMLNRVDSDWDKLWRNGVYVSNHAVFANASNDAVSALSKMDDYAGAVLVSKVSEYQQSDMIALFKTKYPVSVLSDNEADEVVNVSKITASTVSNYTTLGLSSYSLYQTQDPTEYNASNLIVPNGVDLVVVV